MDPTGAFLLVERDWTRGGDAMPNLAGRHRLSDIGTLAAGASLAAGGAARTFDAAAGLDPVGGDTDAVGAPPGILMPAFEGGRVAAALYVHRAEPSRCLDNEAALAREVAARAWETAVRMRTKAALRTSEERFRQFAEHSTDMLWILDAAAMWVEYLPPGRP